MNTDTTKGDKPVYHKVRIAKGITATFSWGGGGVIHCEWNPRQPDNLSGRMHKRYLQGLQKVSMMITERLDTPPKQH